MSARKNADKIAMKLEIAALDAGNSSGVCPTIGRQKE
jgi:hypothetical protein